MSLEHRIVEWAQQRPPWQRMVLKRIAEGSPLSSDEVSALVNSLIAATEPRTDSFELADLAVSRADDPPVRLLSIVELEHVNALQLDESLTFEPAGLTIVYGDNGSGKTGYARVLKGIARARHREDVLSDVFIDTSRARPRARISAQFGAEESTCAWPDTSRPELRRMLYYDEQCGDAYISSESEFPFRPAALFVMDGLIDTCVEIRKRIDEKLVGNAATATAYPDVDAEIADTRLGKCVSALSSAAALARLDAEVEELTASGRSLDDLRAEEAQLVAADGDKAAQGLRRRANKLTVLRSHLELVESAFGESTLDEVERERAELEALERGVQLLAESFRGEPLPGVESAAWRDLWDSARRFSEDQAYRGAAFPALDPGARCVLCQQVLANDAAERLRRFDGFVSDDVQARRDAAQTLWNERVRKLESLQVVTDAVTSNLIDLEPEHTDLVAEVRELLEKYESAHARVLAALPSADALPRAEVDSARTISRLTDSASAALQNAESIASPETQKARLAEVRKQRKVAELHDLVQEKRAGIEKELARLEERKTLEEIKTAAATGPITKKILELSEESITELVRNAFIRETERLHLDRVTIAKTRADRGALLHLPKLVGARQDATLPRVFSEGERTALGLAAFFTEAALEMSKSALILDDPVTSLDHIRRELVASRLVALAEERQVIVFTHDVAFVAALRLEANGKGVSVAERSVLRRRGTDKKPGACAMTHPWKAKDVSSRLDLLGRQVAEIKKSVGEWDEETYENAIATWAGNLSETWERIFSQAIVGPVLPEGRMEVRPKMVKILAKFSDMDDREFQASYSRVSQWAKRHDKSPHVNYVAPDVATLEEELARVKAWFARVKAYGN